MKYSWAPNTWVLLGDMIVFHHASQRRCLGLFPNCLVLRPASKQAYEAMQRAPRHPQQQQTLPLKGLVLYSLILVVGGFSEDLGPATNLRDEAFGHETALWTHHPSKQHKCRGSLPLELPP